MLSFLQQHMLWQSCTDWHGGGLNGNAARDSRLPGSVFIHWLTPSCIWHWLSKHWLRVGQGVRYKSEWDPQSLLSIGLRVNSVWQVAQRSEAQSIMGTGSSCREKDPISARGRTVVFSLTDEQGAGELEGQSHVDVRMPVIWFMERMGSRGRWQSIQTVCMTLSSSSDESLKNFKKGGWVAWLDSCSRKMIPRQQD